MSNTMYFTDDELIRRVWDVEQIKKLVHKRVYYIANEWRRQELTDLWVTGKKARETASFGRNTGYYAGMDAISSYYVAKHESDRQAHLAGLEDVENTCENLSIGCVSNHPASTGKVELAGDGKTAKGIWYSISQETTSLSDGTAKALWMMEKMAIDFLKEDGEWKIWHLVIATDLTSEAGADYSEQPVYTDLNTDPVAVEFGTPTIPMLTHDVTFNWWDDYPPMPRPYYSFSDNISYGPEGHPNYRKEGLQ